MKISLHPVEHPGCPEDVRLVGTLDGHPFGYRDRRPMVLAWGKAVELEHGQVAVALQEAVAEAAQALFGPEWVSDLANVTDINGRSLQRGRVISHGLPPTVLELLAASTGAGRAAGAMLQSMAYVTGQAKVSELGEEGLRRRMDEMMRPLSEAFVRLRAEREAHMRAHLKAYAQTNGLHDVEPEAEAVSPGMR